MTQFKTNLLKSTSSLFVFLILLCYQDSLLAQAQAGPPLYYNNIGNTSGNIFPLNSAASNKVQWIYAPGVFSTSGGGAGTPAPAANLITKVFIKFSNTVNGSNSYPDFTVSLGQNVGTTTTMVTGPFNTGLTQCFYQNGLSLTGITAGGWYGFTLSTPFAYDPGLSLVMEIKTSAASAFGNSVNSVSTATNTRLYGGYAASSGTQATGLTPAGLELIPAAVCTAPPTAGTSTTTAASVCTGSNFNLNLTGNSNGSGQTYLWQSGPSSSGPWTNISSAAATSALTQTASTTQYYQCEVTCSGQSEYSTPVLVTVPAPFPAGNYTIDQTQPASATNFVSFAAAISAISCGIAGSVVFDVVTGTGPYTEQVLIPGTINTNATSTVTINGNGNTLTVPANAVNLYTLGLDGADYITVNNLTIEGTDAALALACHLWNNADNNSFNNCTFLVPLAATATTAVPFSISGSPTSATTTGSSGSGNVLTGCTAVGGYYSMVYYGNSTTPNTGNKAINCISRDMYLYGIYALYQVAWEVNGCTVERLNRSVVSSTYGIYASTGAGSCIIRNNKIRNLFLLSTTSTSLAYCIYVIADGTAGNESQVYNNLIYNIQNSGTLAGLYLSGADYIKAYHNTISLDDAGATAGTTYGIYSTGTVGSIDIKNNIVTITRGGTGTKYGLYYTGLLQTSDNNVVYVNAPAGLNYFGYGGAAQATMALWQSTYSKDLASSNVNPLYNNAPGGDYTPTSTIVNNMGVYVGIATDINGFPRSGASPDPGAIEYNLSSIDMGLIAVTTPNLSGCYGGSEQVTVTIQNAGNDPMDFSLNPATVTVNFNGPASYSVTETLNFGTLGIGASQSLNLNPPIDLTVDGVYNVTGNITVSGDGNPANDNLTAYNITVGVVPGTITSNLPLPVCVSNPPSFTLSGQYGGAKQWQMSTVSASGPWTNVGTGTNTYAPGVVASDYWIQVESTCNSNIAVSNVLAIVVNNPTMQSTLDGTHCGAGTVNLSATPNGLADVNWYANATGGAPLYTGTNYTTPTLSATTTFYASATFGGSSGYVGMPNRVGATSNSGYSDVGLMFNATVPFTLNSVAVYPIATTPSGNVSATIALKNSAGTILASTTVSLPTSVLPGIKTVVPLNFNVPAGTGHRLVFTSATGGGITGFIREATTGFTYPYTYPGVASITSAYTGGASAIYYYYFYDWSISNGCEGVRVPVVANITAAPAITVSALNPAVCPGGSTDISVSSSNDPDYTYTWTSTPSGFSASGNGPHTVSPTNTTTYNVSAEDLTAGPNAGCIATGSVQVIAAPTLSGGTITASQSEICFTGSSILTVTGASGGPIQWEESSVSSSGPWTSVGSGATTYNTGTITQTMYYQVSVSCGANTSYASPFTVIVNTPTITGSVGDTTCGSGSVTLSATASGSSVVNWFANASGGISLATGNTYTPTVSSTTTFYAEPSEGTGGAGVSPILITEMDLGTNDGLEIQNVSGAAVNVTGWKVALGNSYTVITSVNANIQVLSGTLNPGQTLSWTDLSTAPNYWGSNILWNPGAFPTYSGWAAILDNNNVLKDIVFLNWPSANIAGASIVIGTTTITAAGQWSGDGINQTTVLATQGISRQGILDNNTSADFSIINLSMTTTNPGLTVPMSGFACSGTRVPVEATVDIPVSYSGLGATYTTADPAVTLTGTPSGGTFSGAGVVGNTFDPSLAGVGTHQITYNGVSGTSCSDVQTVIVTAPPSATLNLKFYIQGFYNLSLSEMRGCIGSNGLGITANPTDVDSAVVELRDVTPAHNLVYSDTGIVQTNGTLSCSFPGAAVGNSYYIVIQHRNTMETWSSNPVAISSITGYDFSTAATQAAWVPGPPDIYSQVEVETGVWAFYSGDINKDQAIDAGDYLVLDPDITSGLYTFDYVITDITGDGVVDVDDYLIIDPNITAGITIIAP